MQSYVDDLGKEETPNSAPLDKELTKNQKSPINNVRDVMVSEVVESFEEVVESFEEWDLLPSQLPTDRMLSALHILVDYYREIKALNMGKYKWYRWSKKLPPININLLWYSEESDKMEWGTWNYPTCSNAIEVMENLRSGKWKNYGINNFSAASHWCDFKLPQKPNTSLIKEDMAETKYTCESCGVPDEVCDPENICVAHIWHIAIKSILSSNKSDLWKKRTKIAYDESNIIELGSIIEEIFDKLSHESGERNDEK